MDVRVDLNPELAKKLETLKEVEDKVRETAEALAAKAKEMAPVDSGTYQASIEVQKSNRQGGVYRVYSGDPKAHIIEFGSTTHTAKFVFRNAAEALGLTFAKKS